jgi:long-chain acyl-CoA synthetase
MSRSLASVLVETAARHPGRPALKLDDAVFDYALLDQAAARVAAMLKAKGVMPGDRVAIMLPNVPYFPVAFFGVLRAGGVVVPLNVLLKGREVGFHLRDAGARAVFAWHDMAGAATEGAEGTGCEVMTVTPGEIEGIIFGYEPEPEVVARDAQDTAIILYTSGTTGTPKGAELSHANLLRNAEICVELFGLDERMVLLGALPLFHAFGLTCAMNACVVPGGCLTLIPRFDPARALEIIERDRVSVFEGVPTMYGAMLQVPDRKRYDVSSLRLCASGGASLPLEILHAFESAFGCAVLEGYGLSETSPVASFNHPDRERKAGSIGTPIAGVEMKVVDDEDGDLPGGDVGEIVIRGHNVMTGYWGRPEETAAALRGGWFHTGDMARVDDDGYFFIIDRKKDLIIRGGYNVYPREVEEVLYEHPAVREVAVVAVPHPELGEEVGAAVALKPGEHADAETLRAFVKDKVAAYKYPRHVWFVDELPKGATGKILKREIAVPAPAATDAPG